MGPRPVNAFILSVAAGLFLLLSGIGFVLLYAGLNRGFFVPSPESLIPGVIVLVGAVILYLKPRNHALWGSLIIALPLGLMATLSGSSRHRLAAR